MFPPTSARPPLKPERVSVLLNSSAGTAAGKKRDDLRAELEAAFRKHAISASFEFVPGSELQAAAERAVKSAAAGEIDAIVAGGGDGTIHTVASAVAGTDIPLGIIALGTLNHFAKDLKIPLAVEGAVAVISGGVHRSVDVGEVNGEIFINNSSIGIYPYLVLDRDRRRKRQGSSKWPAMIMAGLRAFWNLPLRRLRIRAQNWQEACRSPCVFIGNNEYHLKGSSFGSRERLDGGELCLFVARQQSRLALLWVAVRCVAGLVDQSDLRTVATPAVEVSSRRKRLLVAFDGEIQWMQMPLHYRTRPAALRVLAPLPTHR
jgi:diacylglycerol kinase family enzyme